ncbi:MAG: hypothetical protein VX130_01180 [Verrucomicrobiota bacterium]|nr:hypothetical protein [Verrucomicrobiota bacterium]
MRSTCLSIIRQGWLGIPIFLLGVASLAFSQLAQNSESDALSPEELVSKINQEIKEQKTQVETLISGSSKDVVTNRRQSIANNLDQVRQNLGKDVPEIERISSNLSAVEEALQARVKEVTQGLSTTEGRLTESEKIFADLKENFGGRLEEAQPALEVLLENLDRSASEARALEQLLDAAQRDAMEGLSSLSTQSDELLANSLPKAPDVVEAKPQPIPATVTGRSVVDAIQANEAVELSPSSRFGPKIESESTPFVKESDSGQVIRRLQDELEASKTVQTELSEDTATMQTDLRKAYREIVSLQANLKESQMMVEELERTRNSLWKSEDGGAATADSISKQINRLEYELQQSREDLRQSRSSLLMEQERSNSMIRSISTELERTRRELDYARTAAMNSGADSARLLTLERELTQAKRALEMAQSAPQDASSESYLNLQNELRKALGEIARMQVELGEKNELEQQLIKLRSSLEEVGDSPSRTASPAYVNKLLIDLNAAKREVAKAKAENQERRGEISETVIALEEELASTKAELTKTTEDFERTKEGIAIRELEFANTIKALEEEAQLAQDSLRDASIGKLPTIPFVEEMEENLANSEARARALSERFDTEQERATTIIDGLQQELESTTIRHKRSIDQLAQQELELKEKDAEVDKLVAEKKKLNEELEVVKVIAGQLQDLNSVLEETKATQFSQAGNMDDVLSSMKDELNKAKIELVFALEEKEKIKEESSDKIMALEMQLEDNRKQLMQEQESLIANTAESKDLILDLKGELDAAREEISRMKTAGLGESVETRQAVSQLQEALGTIRILQESLEESEQANVEVDNLRSELAEAMSTQLNELQKGEDEKIKLHQQINDLEAEIALLRDGAEDNAVGRTREMANLREQLKNSQAEIAKLEERLGQSEDSGISSLVELEEELAEARTRNQELEEELSQNTTGKAKTIELLEKELANAMLKLDRIEDTNPKAQMESLLEENEKLIAQLASSDQKAEQDLIELQDELAAAMSRLEDFENQPSETEVSELKSRNRLLEEKLRGRDVSDVESIDRLEDELEGRMNELQALETSNRKLAKQYEEALARLKTSVENGSNEIVSELEREMQFAMERIAGLENEKQLKQEVIDNLRNDLKIARESLQNRPPVIDSSADTIQKLENELAAANDRISNMQEKAVKSDDNGENSQLVADLQKRLEQALSKLVELEEMEQDVPINLSPEAVDQLETELAAAEVTIAGLQSKIEDDRLKREEILKDLSATNEKLLAMENRKLNDLEQDGSQIEKVKLLEAELSASEELIEDLKSRNDDEEKARGVLENRLAAAIEKLNEVESSLGDEEVSPSAEIIAIENKMKQKDILIEDLREQLTSAIEGLSQKETELELIKEMNKAKPELLEKKDEEQEIEILALQSEIDELRKMLQQAKEDIQKDSTEQSNAETLQAQLRDAVAESLEMEAELEQTKIRLAQLESEHGGGVKDEQLQELLDKAKTAEANAFARINELSSALRNSENLRKEMEQLLGEMENVPSQPADIASNPTFIELQKELAMLQKDLMIARDLSDPRVIELEQALSASREDGQRLNEEFKRAMEDFARIKNQVAGLEEENNRLRNVTLSQARNESDQNLAMLTNELNDLEREKNALIMELNIRDKRMEDLRDQLVRSQTGQPGMSPDESALQAQVIRLQGITQNAQDGAARSKEVADGLRNELAMAGKRISDLEESLRQAQSNARGLPSRMPGPSATSSPSILSVTQQAELESLRQQNVRLQDQLKAMSSSPVRNDLDRRIRDLNQKNLTAQIQLDQERSRVEDLRKQLADARDIKQEIVERGQSANLKVDLLNDELSQARGRIQTLENALVSAREAIRILQNGGRGSSSIPVSLGSSRSVTAPSSTQSFLGTGTPRSPSLTLPGNRSSTLGGSSFNRNNNMTPMMPSVRSNQVSSAQAVPTGDSTVQLKAEVQFLNNRKRPAGFTEFFLVNKSLDAIMRDSMVRIPNNQGIDSYAELWARSVQRGYRFPGIAASIRNSLARSSLSRLKTNSVGEANVENIKPGSYFVVGASTLGQVGVVWSKPITLRSGDNDIALDLRDAAWAE